MTVPENLFLKCFYNNVLKACGAASISRPPRRPPPTRPAALVQGGTTPLPGSSCNFPVLRVVHVSIPWSWPRSDEGRRPGAGDYVTRGVVEMTRETANDRFKRSFGSWFWGSMIAATVFHFMLFQFWPT